MSKLQFESTDSNKKRESYSLSKCAANNFLTVVIRPELFSTELKISSSSLCVQTLAALHCRNQQRPSRLFVNLLLLLLPARDSFGSATWRTFCATNVLNFHLVSASTCTGADSDNVRKVGRRYQWQVPHAIVKAIYVGLHFDILQLVFSNSEAHVGYSDKIHHTCATFWPASD